MQCRDARELLDSFLAEELLVETNHELLQHLATCPACRSDLEARSQIRAGLKRAFARAGDLQIRPGFQEEVAARLRTAALTPSRRGWAGSWLAIAAALLLAAVAGLYLIRNDPAELARAAAGDHQNCAIKFALREKPIPLSEAAARYDSAFARLEHTPPDEVPTAAGTLHVADRHSCVFDNRRFGHVVFRLDDHVVSLLMTADDASAASPRAAAASELAWLPPLDGLSLASFHVADHAVYVVSDLQGASFQQVARSLAAPGSALAAFPAGVAIAANVTARSPGGGCAACAWRRPPIRNP